MKFRGLMILLIVFIQVIDVSTLLFCQEKKTSEEKSAIEPMEEIDAGYFYDPKGKRDPFIPKRPGRKPTGPTPGIPCPLGCLVSDMDLQGIVKDAKGRYIAIFYGPDKKSYNMTVGDKFFDAEITAIDNKKVVFKQEVQDPIIKYRELVRWLHPTEEVK